ncbi:hypothetical protein J7E49_20210 [Variovorax paradoxus]|nr:hypothetical protein [Variovorax paradoxus]
MTARGVRWSDALGRLRWTLRMAWERMAWPEFVAAAAIGFALGLALWVNEPLRQEVGDLQAGAALAAAGTVQPVAGDGPVDSARASARSGSDFVAAFMAFLPESDFREQQMQTLHGVARESGVELFRVEYGHGNMEHLPGRRMTMQLAVSAEYAAYRKFLHNLLVAMPNLSIDRVTVERVPGQAQRLNVRLETSLYYRTAATGGAP